MDHALRRARLAAWLADAGIDALLVTRLPNVRYLTGFTGSNGQLLVGGGRDVFFTDGRYGEQARREVPDLERRVYGDGLVRAVAEARAEAGAEVGGGRLGFEDTSLSYATYAELASAIRAELVAVRGAVERGRLVKDHEELDLIRAAQRATDEAFAHLLGWLRAGVTEREAALELELAMRRAGADGPAFDPIVAFGEHAAEPHHDPCARALGVGDVVKVDFGATVRGYRTDMTRTVALGEPPAALRELHGLVRRAHDAGLEALVGGTIAGTVDAAARRVVEEGGEGERFPHPLGHGVGLEIHEDPRLRHDAEVVVPPGAVVTIEPGVYVPGLGGVRIEDTARVTEDGCEPLPASTKELVIL